MQSLDRNSFLYSFNKDLIQVNTIDKDGKHPFICTDKDGKHTFILLKSTKEWSKMSLGEIIERAQSILTRANNTHMIANREDCQEAIGALVLHIDMSTLEKHINEIRTVIISENNILDTLQKMEAKSKVKKRSLWEYIQWMVCSCYHYYRGNTIASVTRLVPEIDKVDALIEKKLRNRMGIILNRCTSLLGAQPIEKTGSRIDAIDAWIEYYKNISLTYEHRQNLQELKALNDCLRRFKA